MPFVSSNRKFNLNIGLISFKLETYVIYRVVYTTTLLKYKKKMKIASSLALASFFL